MTDGMLSLACFYFFFLRRSTVRRYVATFHSALPSNTLRAGVMMAKILLLPRVARTFRGYCAINVW